MNKAPKTSQLGWDMDHVWLLRDGNWTLDGEWRSASGDWREIHGRVEIGDNTARYHLGDEDSPQRLLKLGRGRTNRQAFKVEVQTEAVALSGSVRSFGLRQDLTAGAGNWNMAETALQRSDGSVEVDGIFTRLGEVHDAWRWILRPQSVDETWTVPASLLSEVERLARAGAPIEQCGLLVGRRADRAITWTIPMTNADGSEDHYSMDPAEQFAAVKRLRGTGEDILGHWHSHPFSPARQSDEDITLAADEDAIYGLTSLMEEGNAPFNVFRVRGGASRPVKLLVVA
jgi:proteasome lid subunit RPN8/RPN11